MYLTCNRDCPAGTLTVDNIMCHACLSSLSWGWLLCKGRPLTPPLLGSKYLLWIKISCLDKNILHVSKKYPLWIKNIYIHIYIVMLLKKSFLDQKHLACMSKNILLDKKTSCLVARLLPMLPSRLFSVWLAWLLVARCLRCYCLRCYFGVRWCFCSGR